jgi:maleylpyruvate isomerase
VDAAQRQLSERIDDATQRLLGTARVLTDPDLREPSMLPGWSRAYVLAHLARGADAMRNLLVGARTREDRTGEDRSGYAGREYRAAGTEPGARGSAKDLAADVADSAMALRTITRQLPDSAWQVRLRVPGLDPFPAAQLLARRLVEVELHHADLGAGYGPEDWPADFTAMDLAEPMRTQRQDRLDWAGSPGTTG